MKRIVSVVLLSAVMLLIPACHDKPNYYDGDTIVCGAGEWLNEAGDGCELMPEGRS